MKEFVCDYRCVLCIDKLVCLNLIGVCLLIIVMIVVF